MNLAEKYFQTVKGQVDAVASSQMASIETASSWFAEAMNAGGLVYIFGTGHSHILAEELFYRAGGLARVVPMLHPPLMLHESASTSTQAERDPNVVGELLKQYPMTGGDVLVVASNSGRNACPIELAMVAKERSVRTIAVLNSEHSAKWDSRHPSGKRLGVAVPSPAAPPTVDHLRAVDEDAGLVVRLGGEDIRAAVELPRAGPTSRKAVRLAGHPGKLGGAVAGLRPARPGLVLRIWERGRARLAPRGSGFAGQVAVAEPLCEPLAQLAPGPGREGVHLGAFVRLRAI